MSKLFALANSKFRVLCEGWGRVHFATVAIDTINFASSDKKFLGALCCNNSEIFAGIIEMQIVGAPWACLLTGVCACGLSEEFDAFEETLFGSVHDLIADFAAGMLVTVGGELDGG